MNNLRVLDLFSGIGGFSLGLERAGQFETAAFCEINAFCQGVLRNTPVANKIWDSADDAMAEIEGVPICGFWQWLKLLDMQSGMRHAA